MDTQSNAIKIAELNEKQRRRHYFEKKFPDLLLIIDNYNIDYKIDNFSILLYHFYHKLSSPNVCVVCNNFTKFISFNKGYNKYCSRKCIMSDKELVSKRNKKSIETNLFKYGVDNPMKVDDIKQKVKNTNLKKWGFEYYTQTNHYKERIVNINREKWGVDWYQQSVDFKEKSINKHFEKRGVGHHMKSKKFIDGVMKNNLDKWGVDNFTKTDEYKRLMFKYYDSDEFTKNINTQKEKRREKELNYYEQYNIDYTLVGIKGDILKLRCKDCLNDFELSKQLYYLRNKNKQVCCTICNKTDGKSMSYREKDLFNFIKSIYDGEVLENYKNKYEIDIYLPDLKIGFEFNGLYWHSEIFKEKNYHKNKTLYFKEMGIRIIHIWEDDWVYKNDIIESMIRYNIGKVSIKIGARNCNIRLVNIDTSKKFLNDNHLQGYVNSSIRIGLFYKEELVSLITLGKSRNKNNETEILRFCNKMDTTVMGGFTRLLNYFLKNYYFEKLVTYADISNSNGDLYLKNGLEYEKTTEVGYYWCKNGIKYNRFKFRKDKLIKEGHDKSLTESKIMHERGYYRLYNCGNYKFKFLNSIKLKSKFYH
jgi:hypothetical protein